ncbi:MAG TPA: ADP-forming succinate--CoA ligase subunit beta [Candidatus Atribacteria bacterium]|nr:ADP-forming succinate--CoA ligase subunit beta [Candidatus Atribacteria bacterium]
MKLYEYQAKEIFKKEAIPTPQGQITSSPLEAENIMRNMGKEVVIKSQVLVGGRGKAGGIKFASSPEEANLISKQLIGHTLKGEEVKKVLIVPKQLIRQELYLGIALNRNAKTTTLIFSSAGGMDIEELSKKLPEKIVKINIDPVIGIQNYHFNRILKYVDYDTNLISQLKEIAKKLYYVYKKYDCVFVEINPLAVLEDGSLMALDSKLEIDDNAEYRQKDLMERYYDKTTKEPLELIGKDAGFVVIKLKGTVSIISNGAGLAISTMDLLKKYDVGVANILDLSGGATSEKVMRAVNVVIEDKDVKIILFNIFGGITRCDEIARGIIKSLKYIPQNISIVCRLQGTNKDEGIKILNQEGINAVTDLEIAVQKVKNLILERENK